MTAHQLNELHLTLAQMEVSDRARLAQAAGVNLSTVQKFAMSREHGVPSRTIEPLTPLAIEWSPARPPDPAPQRHALGHGRPVEDWMISLCDAEFPILIVQPGAEP